MDSYKINAGNGEFLQRNLPEFSAVLLGIITLLTYIFTLAPTVSLGDSGEFITNALTLGINHPPGYPLYTLLSRVFSQIFFFLAPAVSVNLFSAVSAVGATVVLFYILSDLTKRVEVSFFTALMYGFSFTLWARATSAEIYTLNIFCILLTLFFALRWYHFANPRYVLLAAFFAGIGLSQHPTAVMAGIGIALLLVLAHPSRLLKDGRLLAFGVLCVLLGLSIYAYLLVRSLSNPPIDTGNPETWAGLLAHIFPQRAISSFEKASSRMDDRTLWLIRQMFTKEFGYAGILALPGIFVLRNRWKILVGLGMILLLVAVYTIRARIGLAADFDAYFLAVYAVLALFIGTALAKFWDKSVQFIQKPLPYFGALFLLALLPASVSWLNYTENDRSNSFSGYDLGQNILRGIDSNAVLFTRFDEDRFLSAYFKYVEHQRTDITILPFNFLHTRWFAPEVQRLLPGTQSVGKFEIATELINRFFREGRRVYFGIVAPPDSFGNRFVFVPRGLASEVLPNSSALSYKKVPILFHAGWEQERRDFRADTIMHRIYLQNFIETSAFWLNRDFNQEALQEIEGFFTFPIEKTVQEQNDALMIQGMAFFKLKRFSEAIASFGKLVTIKPDNVRAWELCGTAQYFSGNLADAERDWEKALSLDPKNQQIRNNLAALKQKR